jgi:mRNA interferase RelE/StbE
VTYQIEVTPVARKMLAELPRSMGAQINERILSLARNPRPPGCGALQGERWKGYTRIRSGNYRIIYRIEDQRLVVVVVKIGNRRDVYD